MPLLSLFYPSYRVAVGSIKKIHGIMMQVILYFMQRFHGAVGKAAITF